MEQWCADPKPSASSLRRSPLRRRQAGHVVMHSVRYTRLLTIVLYPAGCNYPGDYIGDTPYQAAPTTDCTVQNTCPGMPGKDPVHNMVRLESCLSPTALRWD